MNVYAPKIPPQVLELGMDPCRLSSVPAGWTCGQPMLARSSPSFGSLMLQDISREKDGTGIPTAA